DPQMRARTAARARRCRHHARGRRGARCPRALGRDPAQPLMPRQGASKDTGRLAAGTLDEASLGPTKAQLAPRPGVALHPSLENNKFKPVGHEAGPYALQLGMSGNRLVFDIRLADNTPVIAHMLSLAPFRRVVKDYFVICDSYYAAIRTATPDRIEALDMARR